MTEARIVIGDAQLSEGQSMSVRVAVANMLVRLDDEEYRRDLGEIAEDYQARLSEVQAMIITSTQ